MKRILIQLSSAGRKGGNQTDSHRISPLKQTDSHIGSQLCCLTARKVKECFCLNASRESNWVLQSNCSRLVIEFASERPCIRESKPVLDRIVHMEASSAGVGSGDKQVPVAPGCKLNRSCWAQILRDSRVRSHYSPCPHVLYNGSDVQPV